MKKNDQQQQQGSDPQTPRSRRKRTSQGGDTTSTVDTKHDDVDNLQLKQQGDRISTGAVMEGKKLKLTSSSSADDKTETGTASSSFTPATTKLPSQLVKSSVSVKKVDKMIVKDVSSIKFKPQQERYQYGNYNKYYGYRNEQKFTDTRMSLFEKEWFKGK